MLHRAEGAKSILKCLLGTTLTAILLSRAVAQSSPNVEDVVREGPPSANATDGSGLSHQPDGYEVLRAVARAARQAAHDNLQTNPPLAAPTPWTANAIHHAGDTISYRSSGRLIYLEQMAGPACTSADSGPGPTGTGAYIVDGSCIWTSVALKFAGNAPSVSLPAVMWSKGSSFPVGASMVNFAGADSNAVGYFYINNSSTPCITASSGEGPVGSSPSIDGTCVWTYQFTFPTAAYSLSSKNSFTWRGGRGNLSQVARAVGGHLLNDPGTQYLAVWSVTNNGRKVVNANGARIWIGTDAPRVMWRYFTDGSAIQTGVRFIVCNRLGRMCHYVSTNYTLSSKRGWTHTLLDFSAVGGREPRVLGIELDGGERFGGIDIDVGERVWSPRPASTLSMAWPGDSYPAGGGVPGGRAYPLLVGDQLGIDSVYVDAIGGCGFGSLTCDLPDGPAVDRITDVTSINEGRGPSLVVISNGTNDINHYSPHQIGGLLTNYIRRLRLSPGMATTPVFVLGAYAHNNGGVACTACVKTEIEMIAAVTELNDPMVFFCRWTTDPHGSWETGTGSVRAQNGTGDADFTMEADNGHPNFLGNRNLAARIAACILRTAMAAPINHLPE